jgi:N-acetylglucosaminyldiphosphoundecaprenol N-acetyl-beta-D-mannosaminyltransferase
VSEQQLPEPVRVLGISVHPLTLDQLVETIADWSTTGELRRVYNVNTHAMNLAHDLEPFRKALTRADLVYCDGAGVQVAARLFGYSIPERLSVLDWLEHSLAALARERSSLYLLGDETGVVKTAADLMQARHPGLSILGYHHGFFAKAGPESEAIVETLDELRPRVIMVGMGMPTQEIWIEDNIDRLPAAVYIPVGAAFRWYTGIQRRPPEWMRHNGLEWLGRLIMEPKRLGFRYLIGNPRFLARAMAARFTSPPTNRPANKN